MNLELEKEFSKAPIIAEVDALKKQIDDMRPLPPDVEGKVMQKLRLDWNYNSNAIEGNKLSYGETTALLMHGVTAKGKPLKDHLDIQGHNDGINFIIDIVKDSRPLTEADIRSLHSLILGEPTIISAETSDGTPTTKKLLIGEYKKLPNHVKTRTGQIHYYATPEEVPAKMEGLMNWYYEASNDKEVSPLVVASLIHHRFVEIHPFDDGNGRMSRILMNLILLRAGYPIAVVRTDDKDNYYSLLSQADVDDAWPFVEYMITRVEASIKIYLKAINGGDIEEDEDIDKEIALYRMEIQSKILLKEKVSSENVNIIINEEIESLSAYLFQKSLNFSENFFSIDFEVLIHDKNTGGGHSYDASWSKIINELFRHINSKKFYIKKFTLKYNFKEFKNPKNNFNVVCEVSINFEEYIYSISIDDQNEIIKKYYHERLSSQDKSKILKAFIRNLKEKIDENLMFA